MSGQLQTHCWETEGVGGTQTCGRLAGVGHCRNCPVYMEEGRRLLDRAWPENYRAEWTQRVARVEVKGTRQVNSIIPFALGAQWLAIRTKVFQKVVEFRPAHTVPFRSNPVFLGLANVEGEMLLCASLGQALGVEAGGAGRSLLVASHQGARWCFAADQVAGIEVCPASALQAPDAAADDTLNVCLEGWLDIGARQVALLNEARLFSLLERYVMA